MEDHPRNLGEFNDRFSSDEACQEYRRQLRRPEGFVCPHCGGKGSSRVRSVLLRCGDCRHQVSVTAGTIFQDTRIPLRLWFQAMW
jgi:ribosomal protein L37AE/L43A